MGHIFGTFQLREIGHLRTTYSVTSISELDGEKKESIKIHFYFLLKDTLMTRVLNLGLEKPRSNPPLPVTETLILDKCDSSGPPVFYL